MACIKLNEVERRLLGLIPVAPKRITSSDLVRSYYGGSDAEFNGQKIIVGRVSGLIRKQNAANFVDEDGWKVSKSDRSGPKPIYYTKTRHKWPVRKTKAKAA